MSASSGVGGRTPVVKKQCVDSGPRPVGGVELCVSTQ